MSDIRKDSGGIVSAWIFVVGRKVRRRFYLIMRVKLTLHLKAKTLAVGILSIGMGGKLCHAAELPPSTAIPVVFTHTIDAGKANSGTPVVAKTMQIVLLPSGQILPRGTPVVGHVVDSQPFNFDPAPYANQPPSYISVRFDRIVTKGIEIPLNVSVRALANTIASNDAQTPHYLDETDSKGTIVQIGGDQYSPIGKEVLSSGGDIVGYTRKQGIFARLISNAYVSRYASFPCGSTNSEQSVAIFSASACGVYGFDSIYMPENGRNGSGTFRLESRHHTVALYAGSAALLEVNGPQP